MLLKIIHSFKIQNEDKKTSRQRIRADPSLPDIPKFGEHVYFKQAKTVKIPKDESKWRSGIWLGFVDNSNEHIIGTPKGALKCRAIRRHDATEQFDAMLPTNIKESGEVISEDGKVEGYSEENGNQEERFNPGIDPEEDGTSKRPRLKKKKRRQKEKGR